MFQLGCLYNLILILFSAVGLGNNISSGVENCGILNLITGDLLLKMETNIGNHQPKSKSLSCSQLTVNIHQSKSKSFSLSQLTADGRTGRTSAAAPRRAAAGSRPGHAPAPTPARPWEATIARGPRWRPSCVTKALAQVKQCPILTSHL